MQKNLTLNIDRPWLPLILKFYLLVEPIFVISVEHHNRIHPLFDGIHWDLRTNAPNLRNTLVRAIQEVGSNRWVADGQIPTVFALGQATFTPFPVRSTVLNYGPMDMVTVDLTNFASVISDPLCGHNGSLTMRF